MPEQKETTYASAADLLAEVEHVTRDVELPDGRIVKVRGLTRAELIAGGKGTEDPAEIERRNVSTCLLEPRMSRDMVGKWQSRPGSTGALAVITVAIRDLSGLGEGAQKSGVDPVRD